VITQDPPSTTLDDSSPSVEPSPWAPSPSLAIHPSDTDPCLFARSFR